jgi:putative FmdB family regulatory protein
LVADTTLDGSVSVSAELRRFPHDQRAESELRTRRSVVMQRWKLIGAVFLAVAAVGVLVYRVLPGREGGVPTYEWQCARCQHRFRHAIRDAASDLPVMACPACGAEAAGRIVRYQCRKCWAKYQRVGVQATLANVVCPECGSRAARDLDNPIPGDSEPVDGGAPFPGD